MSSGNAAAAAAAAAPAASGGCCEEGRGRPDVTSVDASHGHTHTSERASGLLRRGECAIPEVCY